MKWKVWLLAGALIVLPLSAFSEESASPSSQPRAEVDQRTVEQVDLAGLQKVIESHRGKVLLVDFWATWCVPCVEQFPSLVKLHRELKEDGFEVLAVSLDTPDMMESAVKPFLKKQKPGFSVVLLSGVDPNKFIPAIDPGWAGTIPASFVYDRDGKLVKQFVGSNELKGLDSFVKKEVASKKEE